MDTIKLVHLYEINEKEIIALMTNEEVGKQLPLLTGEFTTEDCQAFIKAKKELWDTHGFGPWAFVINGKFAGWGGLQQEHGDADFALILHPNYWGWGRKIFNKVKDQAFNQMNIESITILFPPSRLNSKAITRLGFREEGKLIVNDETFIRFRLSNPKT